MRKPYQIDDGLIKSFNEQSNRLVFITILDPLALVLSGVVNNMPVPLR